MLGPDLSIRRFNPAAQEMLNLIPADLGRPIGDIRLKVQVPDLESVSKEVLNTLNIQELEVQDREGRWYSLRLRPYRTSDNKIDGVVLVLVDIDALKKSLQEVQAARDYAQGIIATVREPLLVLDAKLRVVSANAAYYRIFRSTPKETEGGFFYELGKRQWDLHVLRHLLDKVLPSDQAFQDFEMVQKIPKIGIRTFLLNGRRLVMGNPDQALILLAIEDVNERRQAEQAQKDSEAKLRSLARQLLALQEAEHQELSSELQESLAQMIAAVKMQLRTFEDKLPEDEVLKEQYRRALKEIDAIVAQLRRRAAELSPQMLADLGLAAGLRSLCENAFRGLDLECSHDLDDLSKSFTLDDQVSIYRIFQEALNNVREHAQATKVVITAKKKENRVEMLVADNGQGFEVGRMEGLGAGKKGIGLAAISERVRALDGTLKVESKIGVGTRIFISIPKSIE
jgi:two-component system CheB/CheR fusion protein